MREGHLVIKKTARYYTVGELNANTKQAWFVLHGFTQNAKDFLAHFETMLNENNFFIAPEALNRFYLKGSGSEVGATWMTKEDRLNEIKDYLAYLDDLYAHFKLQNFQGNIIALGFSQGASTVTRWVNSGKNRIDSLIVYAGEVAPELVPLSENSGLKQTKNYFICGNKDEYFAPEIVAKMKTNYSSLKLTEIEFEGKHELRPDLLKRFLL